MKKYIKDRAIKKIPINNATWDKSKVLKFKKGKRSNDSQLIEYVDPKNIKVNNYWEDEYNIQIITLDILLKSYNFKKIDFICLTINGAEYEALLWMHIDHKKVQSKPLHSRKSSICKTYGKCNPIPGGYN